MALQALLAARAPVVVVELTLQQQTSLYLVRQLTRSAQQRRRQQILWQFKTLAKHISRALHLLPPLSHATGEGLGSSERRQPLAASLLNQSAQLSLMVVMEGQEPEPRMPTPEEEVVVALPGSMAQDNTAVRAFRLTPRTPEEEAAAGPMEALLPQAQAYPHQDCPAAMEETEQMALAAAQAVVELTAQPGL
jgi:hypothetical protein